MFCLFRRSSRPLPPRNNAVNHGADAARGPRIDLYSDEKTLQDRMELYKRVQVKSLNLTANERQIYEQNPHLREGDLDPEASMFTFRVDRNSSKTRFYDGDFVIKPWSSRRSTDCRLVVRRGASTVDHDNRRISGAMSYFQNIARTMYYEHNIDETKSKGLDHGYDCRAEIRILAHF